MTSSSRCLTYYFELAIQQAERAAQHNEVPIGAILVKDGRVIAKAYNQTERRGDFTAHAEVLCLQKASRRLKTKFLNNCELYVTLEPCLMCVTAARLCRISTVHYLVSSPKFGSRGNAYFKTQLKKSRRKQLTQQAVGLLSNFFASRR